MGGKTRNTAIHLVMQQCCKTSYTFLLPVLAHLYTQEYRNMKHNYRQTPSIVTSDPRKRFNSSKKTSKKTVNERQKKTPSRLNFSAVK